MVKTMKALFLIIGLLIAVSVSAQSERARMDMENRSNSTIQQTPKEVKAVNKDSLRLVIESQYSNSGSISYKSRKDALYNGLIDVLDSIDADIAAKKVAKEEEKEQKRQEKMSLVDPDKKTKAKTRLSEEIARKDSLGIELSTSEKVLQSKFGL